MKGMLVSIFLFLPILAEASICEIEDRTICEAANKGDAEAQLTLAYMYHSGEAGSQDQNGLLQAFSWFKKSAENGNAIAQNWVGSMYKDGEIVPQDYKKSILWYKKSAEQGYEYGQFNLGSMYKNGYGVTADTRKAYFWFEKAAEQGHSGAQFELAVMSKGAKTYGKALKLFNKAAENDNAEAQFELASIYHYGSLRYHGVRGVEKDKGKAIYWYEKARSNGYVEGVDKRLDELNSVGDSSNKGVINSVTQWSKSITDAPSLNDEDKQLHVVNITVNIGSQQVGNYFGANYYSNKDVCQDAIKQMYVASTNGITLSANCKLSLGSNHDAPLEEVLLAGVTYMGYQQASKFSTYQKYPISDLTACKAKANKMKIQASNEPTGFFGIFFCMPAQNVEKVLYGG
ncbi:tetratricopeptide repeat protein [Providencia huaxiensis]|uniref:tetratricopeptide repeat protein n=2 Tax=Providencia TaxID=586 RepID=UPI0037582FE0